TILDVGRVGVDAELRAKRRSGAGVALAEYAEGRAIIARPGDHEVTGGVGGDGRLVLRAARGGVDAELRAERCAGAEIPLAEDTLARSVLTVARPNDDEISGRIGGDGRAFLIRRRRRIHEECRAERIAGAVVAAANDVRGGAGVEVRPDDGEVAGGIARDDRAVAVAAADDERVTERGPRAGEAPAEDSGLFKRPVEPDDDEVAGGVGRDRRIEATRKTVADQELRAEGSAGGGVALAEDGRLARPRHHEI